MREWHELEFTPNHATNPSKHFEHVTDIIIDGEKYLNEKHNAHWSINVDTGDMYCSCCHAYEKYEKLFETDVNYCYLCGAKMTNGEKREK